MNLNSVYPDHSSPSRASTAATLVAYPLSARQHSPPTPLHCTARLLCKPQQQFLKSNLRAPKCTSLALSRLAAKAAGLYARLPYCGTPPCHDSLPRSSINCLSMSLPVSPPRPLPLPPARRALTSILPCLPSHTRRRPSCRNFLRKNSARARAGGLAGARFMAGDARIALKLVSPTLNVHISSRQGLPRSSHRQDLYTARTVETTSLSRWALCFVTFIDSG